MSQQHPGTDFADLETMDLTDEVRESIRQARIEARTVIQKLEPQHISSWTDFLRRLEYARQSARASAELIGGVDVKEFDKQFRSEQ